MTRVAGGHLSKLTAFADGPGGGNPAGVWIGEGLPSVPVMQQIAADVGFSETAFLAGSGPKWETRYYSPEAEVSFCGHATVASGVALGERFGDGQYLLLTSVGPVGVEVGIRDGARQAALTSVDPAYEPAPSALVDSVLAAIQWQRSDLDESIPPARAFAGAWHLVLAAGHRDRLAQLDYDFEELGSIMRRDDLTTLQLVWREKPTVFHSRNPFPVGGVVEDPATGAAAAAFGGYLRESGLLEPPAELTIHQGVDMGRPSKLTVSVPESGGIVVSGPAVGFAG
ncbi:MAG: PhzF family phenazine biosynthesis isomerase [Acidimicrobiia bacterium]